MRTSLRGVLARVDRLAERMRPTPEEREARIRLMSDEELRAWIKAHKEALGGPDVRFSESEREQFPDAYKLACDRWMAAAS